jgi:hypothetical protein
MVGPHLGAHRKCREKIRAVFSGLTKVQLYTFGVGLVIRETRFE